MIIIVLALLVPDLASAQRRRVPAKDSAAVGGEAGTFVPREGDSSSGLTFEGFYEYYFRPRTSARFGIGWANPGFDLETDEHLRYVRIAGDLVYNWEGGKIHPFAGAGLGVYFLQVREDGENVGDSETKFGGTLFGGVEWFTSRTFSVKGEARYHAVTNVESFNPDGLSVTVGVKKYF